MSFSAMAKDLNELFPKLFSVMREPLNFKAAQDLGAGGGYIKKPYTLVTLGRAIKMELER